MSKAKAVDAVAPTETTNGAQSRIELDKAVLDAWVEEVRTQIHGDAEVKTGPHGKVGLATRLLAMQWELGQVKPDAVHHHGYAYHSIQAVENHVNRLSAIYRIRIKPTRIASVVLEGGVRLHAKFIAYCPETDEHDEWEWEDDGEDLTKAGSYTQKYALMKFFHMGDGQDPDAEEARGKPARGRASSTQARTPTPRNGGTTAVPDDAKKELYELARTLPANAGWGGFKEDGSHVKIDAMLKSAAYKPENIRTQLIDAHKTAHGPDCEHVVTPVVVVPEPAQEAPAAQ